MRCSMCTRELWMIDGPGYGVHYCRFCDAVPVLSGWFAGPPSLSFTDENGVYPMQVTEVNE